MREKICTWCKESKSIDEYDTYYNEPFDRTMTYRSCIDCRENLKPKERKRILVEGYVYIISNPAWPGMYKVGRSVDPLKRLHSYQTSSPLRDFKLEFYMKSKDVLGIEKTVARYYPGMHEWVKEDLQTLIIFLQTCTD